MSPGLFPSHNCKSWKQAVDVPGRKGSNLLSAWKWRNWYVFVNNVSYRTLCCI